MPFLLPLLVFVLFLHSTTVELNTLELFDVLL